MEYYNHTKTSAYTGKINEQLSLEPNIITTDNEELADFYLVPKLLLSKIERINSENSRYSMSVALELWAKGGVLINTERQNRYIIIENSQNPQEIAKKLLLKLLEDAVNNLSLKIKNLFDLHNKHLIKVGPLEINIDSRELYIDGTKKEVTLKEFELLVYLIKNKGKAVSREQIFKDVWGYENFSTDDRTIDTHIKMLRNELSEYKNFIETYRGFGYKFEVK
jgi:hypothetical protein